MFLVVDGSSMLVTGYYGNLPREIVFEQVKTTIENYRTDARNYNADLDYIFE